MQDILKQIKKALKQDMSYLALFTALTVPDICCAMESRNGQTTSDRYKSWFNTYMSKREPEKYGDKKNFTATDCWNFRCAVLHQGRTTHKKLDYKRILFVERPELFGINSIHCCIVGSETSDKSLLINIEKFCEDIVGSANDWLKEHEGTENYKTNYQKLIKRYPEGLKPVLGCPVIG